MIYALPLLPIVVWAIYLAYASLKIHWHSLPGEVRIVGGMIVLIGWVLDILLNWTFGLALGITKHLTLSQKCSVIGKGTGVRAKIARYICRTWLDPFEQGGHCRD